MERTRKVDVKLPGRKGNSNSHGARPVHLSIAMINEVPCIRLGDLFARHAIHKVKRERECFIDILLV